MVVAAVVSIFFIRAIISRSLNNVSYATYIAAFINFAQIQIFNIVINSFLLFNFLKQNQIYAKVAVFLTNFGNK